jgi:hypothetical protein
MAHRIWRFFVDADGHWRWQQLALDKTIVEESAVSYSDYHECLAAARANGYIHEPAQTHIRR